MIPVVVIAGPTASGKTALSIELAKRIDGEIVCGDSMQIYKYMDIGSAKPDEEERDGVPHHLFGFVDPRDNFSLADYLGVAHSALAEIHSRGKTPIVVGGTGLYIDTLIDNIVLDDSEPDPQYREQLKNLSTTFGTEYIHDMLKYIDEQQSLKISKNDEKRIIRALEIYHKTGKTKTELNILSRSQPSPYKSVWFAVDIDREVLYERINRRVDIMLQKGLVNEVKSLLDMGVTTDNTSMQGIGYKEIAEYILGECSLEEAADMIKQRSRNYAKRQMTWFKRNPRINYVSFDKTETMLKYCTKFI
ncbi:MAG: tRNA (adenosine(37)-N6)-dimethylallyltransferase MiaA [Eubacteriales bacterium]|nr:tRNA (adenosine(37)-N6)-dimethylallyltransferase MiaA [Eubacteriales bacterium]